jgi:alkylation response protein AidB-like acyl-CoA dehydrogenase
MDFQWNPEQERRYNAALEFARDKVTPLFGGDSNRAKPFHREAWDCCGQGGLLGLSLPAAFGGQGLDALTTARVVEGFGKGCPHAGLLFAASAHLYAVAMPILEHGSDDLKQRYLPKLASGEWIGANAITEENAGSDVFALKTEARPDGEFFVLNGAKSFVTNGPVCDVIVTYALTSPSSGYLGISGFVVDRTTPGVEVGSEFLKIGLDSAKASQITFRDCRVPKSQLLGPEGAGARVFTSSMRWERACLFALYVGMMDRQLEETISYVRKRKQFGKALGRHQAMAHRIADMKLRLESARLLLYRACWTMDRGEDATLEVCLSKLAVSEAAVASSIDAIQLHGAHGVYSEDGVERMLRDSIPCTLFSGTSEIQRDLIARELGLL